MLETSENVDSWQHDDDGGANKGNKRRIYREIRPRGNIILVFFSLLLVSLLFTRSKEHREKRDETRLARSIALKQEIMLNRHHKSDYDSKKEMPTRGSGLYRWVDPRLLPSIPGRHEKDTAKGLLHESLEGRKKKHLRQDDRDFRVKHGKEVMDWETMADDEVTGSHHMPKVDYTKLEYEYPELMSEPPPLGQYPPLEPLGELLDRWPQDDLDHPPQPLVEKLLHFDYSDLKQRAAAEKIRDLELPFKMYNVPELDKANIKWTDEYLSSHFDSHNPKGSCEESSDNFFSFFRADNWVVESMGPPPSLDNDFTFKKWAKHASYADKVGLPPSETHYYWQTGVPKSERHLPSSKWSFISVDLPSFSSPEPTFFGFNPSEQKGIQCRFGERGITAATHYDSGRNMVAMITGAKRYILAPPKACPQLGIIIEHKHPAYRHSFLNFGHLNLLRNNPSEAKEMPHHEREWLEVAQHSSAIDTVLKEGEVLYIPSHWFHYITSLQKSAQCNTRSGKHVGGSEEFGGSVEVLDCV